MHNVSLYDLIVMEESEKESFESDTALTWNESNSIYKAVRIFERETGIKPTLKIRLHKAIPSKAGLGGASADAAAVLWYLCEKYDVKEMLELSSKVGSDVPFFVKGGCAIVTGKGERIKLLEPLEASVEIFTPDEKFSTPYMYELVDKLQFFNSKGDPLTLYKALKEGNAPLAKENMYNSFEEVVKSLYPSVYKRAHEKLQRHSLVMMTGSGSAFFGMDIGERKSKRGTHLVAHPRDIQI